MIEFFSAITLISSPFVSLDSLKKFPVKRNQCVSEAVIIQLKEGANKKKMGSDEIKESDNISPLLSQIILNELQLGTFSKQKHSKKMASSITLIRKNEIIEDVSKDFYQKEAANVANSCQSGSSIWGTTSSGSEGKQKVSLYLSINERINLNHNFRVGKDYFILSAHRKKLIFKPVEILLDDLSKRKVLVKENSYRYKKANFNVKGAEKLRTGRVLNFDSFQGMWLQNKGGFINLDNIFFLPEQVKVPRQDVALSVTSMKEYKKDHSVKVELGSRGSWVSAKEAQVVFTFPGQYFMKSLIYFQQNKFKKAIHNMESYIEQAGKIVGNSLNISIANEFIVLYKMRQFNLNEFDLSNLSSEKKESVLSVLQNIDQAIEKTPFDYKLHENRAVLSFAIGNYGHYRESMLKALKLGRGRSSTRRLVERSVKLVPPEVQKQFDMNSLLKIKLRKVK